MNNVIPIQQSNVTVLDLHDDILSELGSKKARGLDIDLYDVVDCIDVTRNYSKIRDYVVRERIATKREFNRAIEVKRVRDELEGDPKTPFIFLDLYCKKYKIKVDYKKNIKQNIAVHHANQNVELELRKIESELKTATPNDVPRLLQQQRLLQDIINCKSTNITTEDLARTLRIKSKELELRFTPHEIDDVIQDWIQTEQANRRFEIFSKVRFKHSPSGEEMWDKMINAVFDLEEMPFDVAKAVLKKLVRQIKRKILNLHIDNHLMPIFIGPQGVGKSTWMKRFLTPLSEMSASTDFRQITDDRNIDIWQNYVLILDEMGYASKADIDVVKNIITSEKLLRRVMRSNNAITVNQNATFFGASNRDLTQLVCDETGMRRFIGMRFLAKPDWAALNSIDMEVLWQSVDEYAPDPLDPYKDFIRSEQEKNRAMSPCEQWVYSLPEKFKNHGDKPSAFWFSLYKEWEKEFFQKKTMDYDAWTKELHRLVYNSPDFPFTMQVKGKGYSYKFYGNNA